MQVRLIGISFCGFVVKDVDINDDKDDDDDSDNSVQIPKFDANPNPNSIPYVLDKWPFGQVNCPRINMDW